MSLATWKAATALGVIGLIMVAGAGTVLLTAARGATEDLSLQGDVLAEASDEAQYNLTVQIGARVEGMLIPISGAEVTVWSVNLTETDDSVTLILTKVATGTSDSDGNATFDLTWGDYLVIANDSGLTGMAQCTIDEDLSGWLLLHSVQRDGQDGAAMHEGRPRHWNPANVTA
jgi:hypothetical protein